MADVPERLFRDDAGAAIERAARLEQENQQLRAELRRIQRPDEVPTLRTRRQKTPLAPFLLGAGVGLLLIGGMITSFTTRTMPMPVARFPAPPPIPVRPLPPGLIGASIPTAAPTVADADDCETPYAYDEQGVKHYKMQCIHPERAR